MANNVSVKCVGVCKGIKVMVFPIKVAIDMYVIPAKGEGYPIILGRPLLIAMNARQDWEKGTLILNPPSRNLGRAIVYNLKEGTEESLEVETLEESEPSLSGSSPTNEEASSSEHDSSLEVCGVTLESLVSVLGMTQGTSLRMRP